MERGIFGVAACVDTCVDVGLGAFLSSVGVVLEKVDLMRCWLSRDCSLSPSWLNSWRYWHSGASLGWSLWENIAQEPLLIHDNGSRFRWWDQSSSCCIRVAWVLR